MELFLNIVGDTVGQNFARNMSTYWQIPLASCQEYVNIVADAISQLPGNVNLVADTAG